MLHKFHAIMDRIVMAHSGTLERLAGDSVMVFFNDPVPVERHAEQAVRMGLAMHAAFPPLAADRSARGFELGLGAAGPNAGS